MNNKKLNTEPNKTKDKLNICFIFAYNYSNEQCSGLPIYYDNLMQALVNLGHKVFLVTLNGNLSEYYLKGINIIKIDQKNVLPQGDFRTGVRGLGRMWARLLFSFKAYREITKLDHQENIDVIDAPELFAQGFFTALSLQRKTVTRIHTPMYLSDIYNERYPLKSIGSVLGMPEMIQTKISRAKSVASYHLASKISKDWKIKEDKIGIIPNGVAIKKIRDMIQECQRPIDNEYMLYFGRLEKRKGVHIISKALRSVFLEKPDISMVFIGKDWGLRKKILEDNKDFIKNIIFFDTMDQSRLLGYVKYAKLVILPSLFENISNACLEAMALGRPVLATYGASFEEIIKDGENGFLVVPGDSQALSYKILECLVRDDLDRIGQKAYESVLDFDITKIAQEHVKFYRSNILDTNCDNMLK